MLPLDRGSEAQDTAAEPKDAKPEQLQVQDPDTGLYFIYDLAKHELSVYDPETHKVRKAEESEVEKAMRLFKEQEEGGN